MAPKVFLTSEMSISKKQIQIINNGKDDLLIKKFEIYHLLVVGFEAANNHKVKPFNDVISEIERKLTD